MTTKLLRQVQEQDQQALADRYNGSDLMQPRRKWAPDALKRELLESEYAAACRARQECKDLWAKRDGAGFAVYRCPITGMLTSGREQSELRRSNAAFALNGLRQAVSVRTTASGSAECAEAIARGDTLQDIAAAKGWMRSKGADRPDEPDIRRVKPFVRLVLLAMAGYYADCDRGAATWRA